MNKREGAFGRTQAVRARFSGEKNVTMTAVGHWHTDEYAMRGYDHPGAAELPLGWTPLRALGAAAARHEMGADSVEFSDYCERNRVTPEEVDRMIQWLRGSAL